MGDRVDKILEAARDRWSTPTGLALALLGTSILLIATLTKVDLAALSRFNLGIIGVVLAGVTVTWFLTKLPRVSRNKVGFGIAIECEDTEHAKRIRSDLIVGLKRLVTGRKFKYEFQFVEYSQAVAKRMTDDETVATAIAGRSRLKFLIWGRARKRNLAEGPSHLIDVRYAVSHAPIPADTSKQVAADFGSVVPSRFVFGELGDVIHLEFAARHLDAVARYLIGTAAALSRDFPYAEELLLDAERTLQGRVNQAEGQVVAVLLSRVRIRLGDLYAAWLSRLVKELIATRDATLRPQQAALVEKLRRYQPNAYLVRVNAALLAFEMNRDIATARRELRACRGVPDAAWRYGLAFLDAYEGDLQRAYESYRGAFAAPLNDASVPTQCEEFIEGVLAREPEKYWLYFCLGLINYRAKEDLEAAKADFERFINAGEPARFPRQIAVARTWVAEIDALLGNATQAQVQA